MYSVLLSICAYFRHVDFPEVQVLLVTLTMALLCLRLSVSYYSVAQVQQYPGIEATK